MNETASNSLSSMVILLPVFNDWRSLRGLLVGINGVSPQIGIRPSVVVVNDGSAHKTSGEIIEGLEVQNIKEIDLIHLHTNIGHQRAIAVGLSEIFHRLKVDCVIVMDADGEDKPEDIPKLFQSYNVQPSSVIVAQRSKRSENLWFQLFYRVYKLVFRIMVGLELDFGNFCLIPGVLLGSIVYNPMSWNHLAASISRSSLSVAKLRTERGARYYGKSGMKFERLVSHGLSAISVYLDTVMIRVLIISSLIMVFSLIGALVVVGLRFLTDLAIPGWATNSIGLLSVLGLQALILSTLASFVILRGRSGIEVLPAIDGLKYINWVERIYGDG